MRTRLILVSLLLSSCSYLHTPVLSPYKMDIRQGNFVTDEMRDKLKLGMSKSQVRYLMGTPLISDAFHGDRWDYVYRLEQRGEIVEKQDMALFFEGDNLVRVLQDGKVVQDALDVPKVAPPVVETPASVAKPNPEMEVLDSVNAWAAAWSAKNARDYLAAYTPDFAPPGMSHDAWESLRLNRISKPGEIAVELNDIAVNLQDDSHASATFTQDYRSDKYRDRVEKTLNLVRQSGRWLIAEELSGKAGKAAKATPEMPSASPAAGGEQAVQEAVAQWVAAWSARDVERYLSSYADSFKPSGMDRAAWEAQRRERINKAASIAVEISNLKVRLRDAGHASASFNQVYRSDSFRDSSRKTLQLEKVGDAWRIVSEQSK
ncbi:MAG: outer membrane protein assembly factor BamE [Nitrosomonadales bacterium]|nr:outer membrane protein assembly factor BamE [Nitrosomonadales bacterium]